MPVIDDQNRNKSLRILFVVQFIVITIGFSALLKISSEYLDGRVYSVDFSNYYVSYLVCFALGVSALVYNTSHDNYRIKERLVKNTVFLFTFLFSIMITTANYSLWYLPLPDYAGHSFRNIYRLMYLLSVFLGSGCAAYNFFCCISNRLILWKARKTVRKPAVIFLGVFFSVFLVDLAILILCKYPGNLQTDSFAQIYQATGDFEYSNHHPFYHTMMIKLFLNIGMKIFSKYNAAVATYSCFQIIFMAACFAYGCMLLYDLGAPHWIIIAASAAYILEPYHIMYSFSMTKDTMFGGFMLAAVVSLLRYMKGIGNSALNLMMIAISGLGVCLFRSNGLFVYVWWTICIVCLLAKNLKVKDCISRLIYVMIAVAVISFIMKHPLLKVLDVSQTDFVESLSIPIQQIARSVVDYDDLTDDQNRMLSEVLSVDKIRESYYHYSSDPLKERIRAEGNEEYLVEHKTDYLKLYISIGITHPASYMAGWIDQTYGFWNAGFRDWHWYDWVDPGIYDNRYGIHRTVINESLNTVFNEYLWLFEEIPALQLFLSMGFHMWLVFVMLFIAIIRRDRHGIIIVLPLVWMLVSLMVATPLSMEFRYFYAVFCVLPIISVAILREERNVTD